MVSAPQRAKKAMVWRRSSQPTRWGMATMLPSKGIPLSPREATALRTAAGSLSPISFLLPKGVALLRDTTSLTRPKDARKDMAAGVRAMPLVVIWMEVVGKSRRRPVRMPKNSGCKKGSPSFILVTDSPITILCPGSRNSARARISSFPSWGRE